MRDSATPEARTTLGIRLWNVAGTLRHARELVMLLEFFPLKEYRLPTRSPN